MKILFTADVHISDWPAHSTYDEIGIPSRLRVYDLLAEDILGVIRERGVRAAFYAGDIGQKHSPRPMVANAIRRFCTTLAGTEDDTHESVWIPGNHDIDGKTGRYDPVHSGLAPLVPTDRRGVRYYDRPAIHAVRGPGDEAVAVYVRPWIHGDLDYDQFPAADLFVGHGMVKGSRDPFNYTFTGGYDAEELGSRYALSVLGDIHQAQVIQPQRGRGRVLIPGQPIQVNHSSGEQVGVWIYDTTTDELEHVPSSAFPHADEYHRFLTVADDPPTDAPANVHYRRRATKSAKARAAAAPAPAAPVVDVLDLALREYRRTESPHPELGEDLIRSVYNDHCTTVQPDIAMPPGLLLGKLTIDNFYSVDHAEFDFNDLIGDVLVVGANGSGKSTFAEAVYWCLTGNTTKGTAAGDISNDLNKRPATVRLEIHDTTGGSVYTVVRSRDSNALLEIYSNGSKITKASVRESQEWLYRLLGLQDHRDILVLLYFSTAQLLTFSDYTAAEQNQLLGRLTDIEKYEALKAALQQMLESATADYRTARDRTQYLSEALAEKRAALAAALRDWEQATEGAAPTFEHEYAQLEDLTGERPADPAAALALIERAAAEAEARIDAEAAARARALQARASEYQTRIRVAQSQLEGLQAQIATVKQRALQAQNNHCPECGQDLPDTTLLDRLRGRLRRDADEARDRAQRIPQLRAEAAAVAEELAVENVALERNAAAELTVRSLRAIELTLSRPQTYDAERAALRARIDHHTADVAALENKARLAADEVAVHAPHYEVLKHIATKMLAKNSAFATALIRSVFEDMVAKVNELVGNPKVFYARAEVGRTLGMSVSFNGEKAVRVQNMSAGQRRLLDIMVMLAVNALFEQRYNIENGMLGVAFYDEVVAYLDPEYLDIVFTALSNTRARTRVMITHDPDLMSYYNRTIRVARDAHYTRYQLINT